MKRQLEEALFELLTKHQDADTVTEVVRRLTKAEVRLTPNGRLCILDKDDNWIPTFKVSVNLEVI